MILIQYIIPAVRASVDVDDRTVSLKTSTILDGQGAENRFISNKYLLWHEIDIHRGGACNVDEPSQGSSTRLGERFQLRISFISRCVISVSELQLTGGAEGCPPRSRTIRIKVG